jgi:LysM repeat protein
MEYIIDQGDTIGRLAKRFDMTPEELVRRFPLPGEKSSQQLPIQCRLFVPRRDIRT